MLKIIKMLNGIDDYQLLRTEFLNEVSNNLCRRWPDGNIVLNQRDILYLRFYRINRISNIKLIKGTKILFLAKGIYIDCNPISFEDIDETWKQFFIFRLWNPNFYPDNILDYFYNVLGYKINVYQPSYNVLRAIINKDSSYMGYLLNRGYNIDSLTLKEVLFNYSKECLIFTLKFGANPNKTCHPYSSFIFAAINKCSDERIEILLKYGTRCDILNNEGFTPLMMALLKGRLELFKYKKDCYNINNSFGINLYKMIISERPEILETELFDFLIKNGLKK